MEKVLVAGGTGYFGGHMIRVLHESGYEVVAIARSEKKIRELKPYIDKVIIGSVTRPEDLKGIMDDVDMVITSIGITRQKDGVTYMDVDYGANMNLLEEALRAGVKRFMYISALNGQRFTQLKIMNAKERFVSELKKAPIDSYVIRPSGFFSDIKEIYDMAKKGRAYVFGQGEVRANPIHGHDLANFCLDVLKNPNQWKDRDGDYSIGGPDVLNQEDIAQIAFKVLGKQPKITHIPSGVARALTKILPKITKQSFYGPIEFFLTVLLEDMVGPTYGTIRLEEFFESVHENE